MGCRSRRRDRQPIEGQNHVRSDRSIVDGRSVALRVGPVEAVLGLNTDEDPLIGHRVIHHHQNGRLDGFSGTGEAIQPTVLVMVDYAMADERVFVGVESENRFNWTDPEGDGTAINDASIGPNMILPFDGLSITTS